MIQSKHLFLTLSGLLLAAQLFAQNNTLRGRVLYQSSGNKPAAGVRIAEPDANPAYSVDNGDYRLTFQQKRNGASLALEVGKDNAQGQKLELVNEKEVKAAKLPADPEYVLEIIVCPAGQRDIAAQRYYRILRTTADRELEKVKKEFETVLAQQEKDYQKITDLSELITKMQQALDSAKIREQAFNIASINLDRASQMVKDVVRKIEEDNDVEGALKILNAEALDTAYLHASAIKRQGEAIVKKADAEIRQVIEGYEFRISLLEPQFKYGEMAGCFEKIIEIYINEEYNKEELATYYTMESTCWFHYKDYQKALIISLKALDIREKILPADHPDLALAYNNLAFIYSSLIDNQKAEEFALKAISIREKVLPSDHLDLATSYTCLALIYSHRGNYQKAMDLYQKALKIQEKGLPADHPKLANLYNILSYTYLYTGEFQKSLEFVQKASAIFEKALPANHPELADLYTTLSTLCKYRGEHQKALEFTQKALLIQEKVLPTDHLDLAISYNDIASGHFNLGNYQKSIEFNHKALFIREKVLPADHYLLAISYNNLATSYTYLVEYQKAFEFYLKALVIFEKTLRADHPNLIIFYSNIGGAYRDIGNYTKAVEYGEKAIRMGEASVSKNLNMNHIYTTIGITYVKTRQYLKAKAALEKSENLKAERGVYRAWAMYYAVQKQKKKAIESLQKAVELGFKDLKWLETEPDLKNIRKEKGYKELVEQLKKR